MTEVFTGSFTQQEPIPEDAIAAAVAVMRHGRLHRYGASQGEVAEAALLEQDFAAMTGARYALAVAAMLLSQCGRTRSSLSTNARKSPRAASAPALRACVRAPRHRSSAVQRAWPRQRHRCRRDSRPKLRAFRGRRR